jgi:hypothetical protein
MNKTLFTRRSLMQNAVAVNGAAVLSGGLMKDAVAKEAPRDLRHPGTASSSQQLAQ